MNVEAITKFYNHFAGAYDLVFDHVFREGRVESIRAMELRPGDKILEVGVGTGLNLPLYPGEARVSGIDLSGPMLREALDRLNGERSRGTVALARMDATRLAFPDNCFDVVYAPYVVSVVPLPRRVVAEMARVCRPDGMVVVVNHFESRHPVGRWLERRFSPLTHRVGFRLDLPVDDILGIPGLALEQDRRVNLLKLWRVLVFRKLGPTVGQALPSLAVSSGRR